MLRGACEDGADGAKEAVGVGAVEPLEEEPARVGDEQVVVRVLLPQARVRRAVHLGLGLDQSPGA